MTTFDFIKQYNLHDNTLKSIEGTVILNCKADEDGSIRFALLNEITAESYTILIDASSVSFEVLEEL